VNYSTVTDRVSEVVSGPLAEESSRLQEDKLNLFILYAFAEAFFGLLLKSSSLFTPVDE